MGTIAILPDALHKEQGNRTLGGGAVSSLAAISDGSNATWISQAAGTPWSGTFRFGDISGSLPANALVVGVQMEITYSHAQYLNDYEMIQPETILVGKPAGGTDTFYTYTPGEHPTLWSEATTAQTFTGPKRRQGYDGTYLGRHYYLKPGTRFYGGFVCVRNTSHNTARLYGARLIVHYNEIPVTNVIAPTGTILISRPPVVWDYTDPEANKQLSAHIKIFTEAQTLAAGFDPLTSTAVYDKLVWTSLENFTPERAFGTNGNYVVYVRNQHGDAPEGPSWSLWDSSAFTLNVESPAAPSITATYDASANAINVMAEGEENMLSWAHSSFESVPSPGVTAEAGTTLTRTQAATAEPHGTWSYLMERTASTGTAAMTLPAPSGTTYGIPITTGNQYQARAQFRTAVTGRSCNVAIDWISATGATLSTSTGSNITDTTSGWTQATVTANAPANAVWARVRVSVLSALASEDHYVDAIGLFPGTVSAWTRGGFVHADHLFDLERSLDAGVTWADVPTSAFEHDPFQQTLDYWDYRVPSGVTARYRARVNTINQDGDPVSSPWSSTATAAMPALTRWWIRDLSSPGELSMPLHVADGSIVWPNPQTVGYGLGDSYATVTGPGMKDDDLSLRVFLLSGADYSMFRSIVKGGNTLLIQDTFGRQWFVRPKGDVSLDILRSSPLPSETTPTRHAHTVTVDFVSVEPPSG